MNAFLHQFLFGIYPYICLAVFIVGSALRFERDQYRWRSGSSQLLRARQLRWGSNLFHVGILFILFGHAVGLLTPHELYILVITPAQKQLLAIVSGGIAGIACFVGLSLLIHRRLFDSRIRATSSMMDVAILLLIWLQLVLGLVTLPFSWAHRDGGVMIVLSDYVQHILTFRGGAAALLVGVDWPFLAHMLLGMTLFLLFPFSRLVHIWSAPIGYLARPYQIVRRRGAGS